MVALRFSFDDDPLLQTAIAPGRARRSSALAEPGGGVDLLAFRRHGPCPHGDRDVPPRRPASECRHPGQARWWPATLAASEALWLLVDPG